MPTPDHKFDFDYDKQANLLYEKRRIIDMLENLQALPDVEWDAEPVRYFKLNQEWAKIVFGWLTWLEDVAGWSDAEDLNYPGIQGIIKFEEGINGTILMTPDEFRDALDAGMYSAFNKLARQIVSGRYTDIAVDENGNVSQPSDSTAGDIPDDPETPQDENAESKAGSCIGIEQNVLAIFKRRHDLYGSDVTADTPLADAINIMQALYTRGESNPALTAAMTDYYSYRAGSLPVIDTFTGLAEQLFCEGETITEIVEFFYDLAGNDDAKQNAVDLVNGTLDSDWMNLWIMNGGQIPSTAYKAYSCVPAEIESASLNMGTAEFPQYTTNAYYKAGHRLLFEFSGSFVDTDNAGIVQDFFYQHNTTTGIKTFVPTLFQIQGGPGSFSEPTLLEVPFSPSHVYRVTIDVAPLAAAGNIIIGRDNSPFNLPNTSGIINFTITDLGKYTP